MGAYRRSGLGSSDAPEDYYAGGTIRGPELQKVETFEFDKPKNAFKVPNRDDFSDPEEYAKAMQRYRDYLAYIDLPSHVKLRDKRNVSDTFKTSSDDKFQVSQYNLSRVPLIDFELTPKRSVDDLTYTPKLTEAGIGVLNSLSKSVSDEHEMSEKIDEFGRQFAIRLRTIIARNLPVEIDLSVLRDGIKSIVPQADLTFLLAMRLLARRYGLFLGNDGNMMYTKARKNILLRQDPQQAQIIGMKPSIKDSPEYKEKIERLKASRRYGLGRP